VAYQRRGDHARQPDIGGLPPYSPDLNAIERVWEHLSDRYLSGCVFPTAEAVVEACCWVWNALLAETGRIRSLTDFRRARPVKG
jgi:transposase